MGTLGVSWVSGMVLHSLQSGFLLLMKSRFVGSAFLMTVKLFLMRAEDAEVCVRSAYSNEITSALGLPV